MKQKNLGYTFFFGLFTMAVFGYILIRSSLFSFTEDEAFSLFDVLYMNIAYLFGCTPNSHLVNSFFLWIDANFIGYEEWVLRLHSSLSFLVFAWAVYKISLYIREWYYRVLFVPVITLHPFMIDYFSLARGYAMSIAFMLLSLYFLYEYWKKGEVADKRKIYLSFVFGAIAVLASYTLLNFYLAILVLYAAFPFLTGLYSWTFPRVWQRLREEKLFWIANTLFLAVIVGIVLKMGPSSLHHFWPFNSFWGDTVYSQIELFSRTPGTYTPWFFALLVILISGSFVLFCYELYQKRKLEAPLLFMAVFILIAVSLFLQYHLLNITYISHRAALFLYPLMVLPVFWSFTQLNVRAYVKIIQGMLLFPFCLFVLVSFFSVFSFSRGIIVAPKSGFDEVVADLGKLKEDREISLGVSHEFPAMIYYYLLKANLSGVRNIGMGYESEKGTYIFYTREPISTGVYDYFILEEREIEIVQKFQPIQVLKRYPESGILLAKAVQ